MIVNAKDLSNVIRCTGFTANYLIKKGFIPISNDNGDYIFAKSDGIIKEFENTPFYLKAIERVCGNGK